MATPICRYFGKCGGCTAQHIDYSLQLENKKKVLARAAKFEDIAIFHDNEYQYRNRMDFIFHSQGLGFRKRGQWDQIVDIDRCEISSPRLNKLLEEIRTFFKNPDYCDIRKRTGTLFYAVIRTPGNTSSISFVLNERSSKIAEAVEKIKEFAKATTAENVVVTYSNPESGESATGNYFIVKGSDMLHETFLGKTFKYSVQGFFQNNSIMAEKMINYSHDLLEKYDTKNAHLLDLYGGVGTFGIINSDLFKDVSIVESFKLSIDAANNNIKANNITNVKTYVLDAKQLRKINLPKPLYVITDPPRTGMHLKTIERLNELLPETIIYISCNVEQLAKELPRFRKYKIKSAALFDLFPQTTHSESVVELVKTD